MIKNSEMLVYFADWMNAFEDTKKLETTSHKKAKWETNEQKKYVVILAATSKSVVHANAMLVTFYHWGSGEEGFPPTSLESCNIGRTILKIENYTQK